MWTENIFSRRADLIFEVESERARRSGGVALKRFRPTWIFSRLHCKRLAAFASIGNVRDCETTASVASKYRD
jgi:hypothetical protein